MIERYSPREISNIWSEESKFQRFLEIEILIVEALASLGKIPRSSAQAIRARATINIPKIQKIEEKTHHDIVAFVLNLSQSIGKDSQYIHKGITSSDILDTTLAWQLKDATSLLLADLKKVLAAVKEKSLLYKHTQCVARTHGVHAEPYLLGLKFLYLYNDLLEECQLLEKSREYVCQGKISGAVGTYAHIDPAIERYVCRKLGIYSARISTQIVSRERFAYYLSLLSLLGGTLERFATEIRHLQRTEVGEVEEPFRKGQKGSSAMPHKKNPVLCERICGLARVLRGNMLAAYENINLWHERDISHSSAERVILPDSTIALNYMLRIFYRVVKDLTVSKDALVTNLQKNKGLIYSQRFLVALMEKGFTREKAYDCIQKAALAAFHKQRTLGELLADDPVIKKYFSQREIQSYFDVSYYVRNVDAIYRRFQGRKNPSR